jgi:hypothetical protein
VSAAMAARSSGSLFLIVTALGCGSAPPPVENAPAGGAESSSSVAEPTLTIGPAAWQLWTGLRIEASGEVRSDGSSIGVLTPDGQLHHHGVLVARIDADGWIWEGESRTRLRVVDGALIELRSGSDEPLESIFRIDGDHLTLEESDESMAIEGFRPELAKEVLFVSGFAVISMAAGMQH